jgi:hypothetical protein
MNLDIGPGLDSNFSRELAGMLIRQIRQDEGPDAPWCRCAAQWTPDPDTRKAAFCLFHMDAAVAKWRELAEKVRAVQCAP